MAVVTVWVTALVPESVPPPLSPGLLVSFPFAAPPLFFFFPSLPEEGGGGASSASPFTGEILITSLETGNADDHGFVAGRFPGAPSRLLRVTPDRVHRAAQFDAGCSACRQRSRGKQRKKHRSKSLCHGKSSVPVCLVAANTAPHPQHRG